MVKLKGIEVTFNYPGMTLWACTFVIGGLQSQIVRRLIDPSSCNLHRHLRRGEFSESSRLLPDDGTTRGTKAA